MPSLQNKKPIYTIRLDGASMRLTAYSVLLFFLAAGLFSAINNEGPSGVWVAVLGIFVYAVAVVTHEFIHGLAFTVFGGKVKYGVGIAGRVLPYAYATAPGQPFTIGQMLVVGLSPLVILCSLSALVAYVFPATAPLMGIVFIGNMAGAVGDLWLMSKILKFRKAKNVLVVDQKEGMEIYADGPHAAAAAAKLQKQADNKILNTFIVSWFIASLIILGITALAPIALTIIGYTGSFSFGPSWFALVSFQQSEHETVASFNLLPAVLGGLLFALLQQFLVKTSHSTK